MEVAGRPAAVNPANASCEHRANTWVADSKLGRKREYNAETSDRLGTSAVQEGIAEKKEQPAAIAGCN